MTKSYTESPSTVQMPPGVASTDPTAIADALRGQILRGELPGGVPLRQDEIGSRFGVSRIPVREALRLLAAEGLVSFTPNRGASVLALQPDEATEILEIRVRLEIMAVELGLPSLGRDSLDGLAEVLARSEATADVDEWSSLNWRFHETLYAAAGRARLLRTIAGLHANVDRYIRLLISRSDYRLQAEDEHRAILACCRVGNVAAVSALVEQHGMRTADVLRSFLTTARR